MASSSSSPSSTSVVPTFLVFRGDDTQYTFIHHLYAALVQKGKTVSINYEWLGSRYPVSPDLLKVIEESKIAVVIFSKSYAEYFWCLDELAKIMECQERMGQKVLPDFYYVDISTKASMFDLSGLCFSETVNKSVTRSGRNLSSFGDGYLHLTSLMP
uniref:disease resistance protein RPV1-like n=1 Tax=Erigeron canadensis TaxID=72917 RepID=UPI001CB95755|nr:disease resistance protein RPV1-like [Erigeron canadensis]